MRVAYISPYLPRECGIATFNSNVVQAILTTLKRQGQSQQASGFGVALNDSDRLEQYEYPEEVRFVVRQERQ